MGVCARTQLLFSKRAFSAGDRDLRSHRLQDPGQATQQVDESNIDGGRPTDGSGHWGQPGIPGSALSQ